MDAPDLDAPEPIPVRWYTTRTGVSVASDLDDAEAAAYAARGYSQMAGELAFNVRRGAGLSLEQRAWLHVMAVEQRDREREAERQVACGLTSAAVEFRGALARASRGQRYGARLTFRLARSLLQFSYCLTLKNAGRVWMTNAGSYGSPDNLFFGSIELDGGVRFTDDAGQEVRDTATAVIEQPAVAVPMLAGGQEFCPVCGRGPAHPCRCLEVLGWA